MKKFLLLLMITAGFNVAGAQTKPGPAEQKFTGALCDCISKLDKAKLTSSKEANKAFMDCFTRQAEYLPDVAAERGVEMTDDAAMDKIGSDIGANLMKQKCDGFIQLALKMADKGEDAGVATESTTGTFKRIDNKGFNYIVIADNAGSQKSFLWLQEFKGSDKFAGVTTALLNKKLKVTWQEIEVYLPAAKGYYKVKEITAIDVL
ncbi:hypothetical protein [Mucilaginibacter phyllosphaerae]|uniref:Uncharacterized protein n=1 Tax=Mucilaginibacter phyllosphaerae TaxID=1812349 RepID=A0A4Y8AL20_9SPHI|nr:hypothetical protein [Mucilaginibacter phyllosphaerae]MBB3967663.1 hypothetical protein [Mucilaginibacter phyllosphaerae]TEW69282.1 hypothetical protein E2R65_03705 [Mucilaginibacter phyllosphaerae]GGH04135.1 hypothetical protein GCM10007352_07160 [Mucilaginibacter phyllosphaerae]